MIRAEDEKLSGPRKAAILLSILGEDAAAPVLRELPAGDLERIAEEISQMGEVPLPITLQVLEEHQQRVSAQECVAMGGQEWPSGFSKKP